MTIFNPTKTLLYSIEEAIKSYRKLAQNRISTVIKDITVDQALILILIQQNPTLSQKEVATLVFKDNASLTRIINLMVSKDYLSRSMNPTDMRKQNLYLTNKGEKAIKILTPIIEENRKQALKSFTKSEIKLLNELLKRIVNNCS